MDEASLVLAVLPRPAIPQRYSDLHTHRWNQKCTGGRLDIDLAKTVQTYLYGVAIRGKLMR